MPFLTDILNTSDSAILLMGNMKNILASDEETWITIHPYGFLQGEGEDETKQYYRRICIESETGDIIKGLGAGHNVKDLPKVLNKKQPKQPKTDKQRINDFIEQRAKKPESEWLFQDINKARELDIVKKYKPLERALSSPEYRREVSAILLNKEFKDKKELLDFLDKNYPFVSEKVKENEKAERFRMNTPTGRFFGPNGRDKVSDKYFKVNHRPDENTVILEAPINRLRVVGKEEKRSIIFLTDKNKGVYIDLEKNGVPVRNELYGGPVDTLCVKFKKDGIRTYTFKKDFDNTEDLKPLNNFEDFQKLADEQDNVENRTAYKIIKRDNLDIVNSYNNIKDAVEEHHRIQKNLNTETVKMKDNSELDKQLKENWNGKIYTYKDGTQAIFSNNKRVILTKEQADYIRQNYRN